MSELKGAFSGFLQLDGKEKKKRVDSASMQVSHEVFKRLSAYRELNLHLRSRYKMGYKDFRESGRRRLRLSFQEHKTACDLWKAAHEGMESLGALFLKLTRQKPAEK
jgi:hypothetical protein